MFKSLSKIGKQAIAAQAPAVQHFRERNASRSIELVENASKSMEEFVTLHEKQQLIADDPTRFKVVVSGRRFGKTRLQIEQAYRAAFEYEGEYSPLSPPVVLVGMPSLKECKKKFFWPMESILNGHPLVKKIDRSEFIIRTKGDRPDIYFCGLNEGIRGDRIFHACLDEFQDVKPHVLDEVIMFALLDTPGSRAIITGTPKGRRTHFYQVFQRQETLEHWKSFRFSSFDNPHLDPATKQILEGLDPRTYRQEAEASWEDFQGKIFTEFTEENISPHTPAEFDRVFGGVDWGDRHPALVVIGQKGDKFWIVDEWFTPGDAVTPPDVFEAAIAEKSKQWDVYRWYCDPSRPAQILKLRTYPHPGMQRTIKGFNGIQDGLTIVNSLCYQKRFMVRSQCSHFIECMDSYHRAEKDGVVTDAIAHDQDDHVLDAARYCLATLLGKSVGLIR